MTGLAATSTTHHCGERAQGRSSLNAIKCERMHFQDALGMRLTQVKQFDACIHGRARWPHGVDRGDARLGIDFAPRVPPGDCSVNDLAMLEGCGCGADADCEARQAGQR